MPIKVICSCGSLAEYSDGVRGVECSCDECGRVYRLPLAGDALDLSLARGSQVDFAELQRLAGITPNAKQAGEFSRGGPGKAKLVVSLLILLGILGAAIYGLLSLFVL